MHNTLQLFVFFFLFFFFFFFFSFFSQENEKKKNFWNFQKKNCLELRCQPYPEFCEKQRLLLHNFLISSENGFSHFKEQLKHQTRLAHRKKLFVILCSAVQKLQKHWLLIRYRDCSFAYLSISPFILSIYLFDCTPGDRSLLPNGTLAGCEGYF